MDLPLFNREVIQRIMRISLIQTILVFSLLNISWAESSLAQSQLNKTISVHFKDETLENVVDKLERMTGVNFIYSREVIQSSRKVSFSARRMRLGEILDQVLEPLSLNYTAEDNRIIIRKNKAESNLPPPLQILMVPDQTVKGNVTDSKGEPLPGVNIMIKGTSRGTSTNTQGFYQIDVPDRNAILIFSYVGFTSREILVGNQQTIDIQLEEDTKSLNEVVVTALGLKREKRSLGYAVGEVGGKELNRVPQENPLGGLQGKVTGLQINNSSPELNAETHVYIRGTNSLTNNDAPLVIVDGVPSGNPNVLRDISSSNIESISVLKGPSAAALYGSRAGNGVILITTKTGLTEPKGLGISFNSGYTATVPYQFIEMQNRFTTGKRGIFDESAYQHWYGPEEGTVVPQWNTQGEARPLKFYPHNRENFFQTGYSLISDISVGGNYEKGHFRVALNHLNGVGNTPGMDLNRIGMNLAAGYNLNKNLTVSTNLNIQNSYSDNFFTQLSSLFSYIDINTVPPHVDINELRDYWEIEGELQRNVNKSFNNPWFEAYEHRMPFRRDRRIGNIALTWDILPTLSLTSRLSENFTYENSEELSPWSLYGGRTRPRGGYNSTKSSLREINAEVLLSYKKEFGDFYIAPSVGGNLMKYRGESSFIGGDNLVIPGLYTASNIERAGLNYSTSVSNKEIHSVYGLVSTSFRDLVYLDFTARNDWSSTLPADVRSYFYPSVSASLMVNEIINMPKWVNMLKLRSGWAQVGKDTDPYTIHNVLNRGTWGNLTYYTNPTSLPNTRLKPEIATSYEAGFDISAFSNRLKIDFTFYQMNNRNQILDVNVSQMSGYSAAKINAGVVENWGTEIGIHATPLRIGNWEWNTTVNFTRDRNRLKELTNGVDQVLFWQENGANAITRVGEQLGDIYGYDALRVKEGPYAGWALLNSNGKLQQDNSQLVKIGNYMHDFMMGFQNTVRYKSISLSASIDWRQGGNFYSNTMQRFARSGIVEDYNNGVHSSTFTGILNAHSFGGDQDRLVNEIKSNPEIYRDGNVWIGGRNEDLGGFLYNGVNNGAFFPGVIAYGQGGYIENFGGPGTRYINTWEVHEPGGGYWDIAIANRFVYDASFVKLRELALTYDLPKTLVEKARMRGASVSVFARNIILWTGANIGIDPELAYMRRQHAYQSRGIERFGGAGPWVASGGITLKLDF